MRSNRNALRMNFCDWKEQFDGNFIKWVVGEFVNPYKIITIHFQITLIDRRIDVIERI